MGFSDESLQHFIDRTICHVRKPFPMRPFAELVAFQTHEFPSVFFEPSYVYAPLNKLPQVRSE